MKTSIKRLLKGRVISKKMQKTVTVEVKRTFMHPSVHKVITTNKTFHVHDPSDIAKVGDEVEFFEGRPISKTKYMHLHRVVTLDVQQAVTL